jgi:hypothetical protein
MSESKDYLTQENENQMKEWDKAREVLKDYDTRLHELRKYGFSFVTALLTAGSFITQAISSSLSESTSGTTSVETSAPIPGIFNLGVFVVTLMLIVALHLLDRNYRAYQQAAYNRAKVLERKLNLELSETIEEKHGRDKIDRHVWYVYVIFIVVVAGLGIAILYPYWVLMSFLAACAIGALWFMNRQNRELKLRYKKPYKKQFKEGKLSVKLQKKLEILEYADWTISPLECTRDDMIRIALNNMGDGPIVFDEGEVIWEIKNEYGDVVRTQKADKSMTVYASHVWVVKPAEFEDKGVERVYRLQPRYWGTPLPISIIVHNSLPPKKGVNA